jgi:hypothetical protein
MVFASRSPAKGSTAVEAVTEVNQLVGLLGD